MNELTTLTIPEKYQELIGNIRDGTIISISLDNEDFDDVLRSITVRKESITYELKMDDFFDKKVLLFYNKNAKLLPKIVEGQIDDIEFHDGTLYWILIQKGDNEFYHLFFRTLSFEFAEHQIFETPIKIPEYYNEFLQESGDEAEILTVDILVETLVEQE